MPSIPLHLAPRVNCLWPNKVFFPVVQRAPVVCFKYSRKPAASCALLAASPVPGRFAIRHFDLLFSPILQYIDKRR